MHASVDMTCALVAPQAGHESTELRTSPTASVILGQSLARLPLEARPVGEGVCWNTYSELPLAALTQTLDLGPMTGSRALRDHTALRITAAQLRPRRGVASV